MLSLRKSLVIPISDYCPIKVRESEGKPTDRGNTEVLHEKILVAVIVACKNTMPNIFK